MGALAWTGGRAGTDRLLESGAHRDAKVKEPADSPTLLERIAHGDASAIELLVDRYGATLRSMARRWFEAGLAEDVVQGIFLSLWRSADRFDPARSSEPSFVATVAKRRLIDLRRRHAKRRESDLETALDVAEEPRPDRAEQRDEVDAALAALAQLRPAVQQVLRMAVVEGLTHEEIATATRLPLGTVKSHARRGLERIRALVVRPAVPPGPDPKRGQHG